MSTIAILWFRRDLRLADNPALTAAIDHARETGGRLLPIFIWDRRLYAGRRASPNRTWYLRESLAELSGALEARGSRLLELGGTPNSALLGLIGALRANGSTPTLFTTADQTPYAQMRDRGVRETLAIYETELREIAGPGIVEPAALTSANGSPYRVFTPYHRAWLGRVVDGHTPLAAPERLPAPAELTLPPRLLPDHAEIAAHSQPSARRELLPAPGERAAREMTERWLASAALGDYALGRDRLGASGGTSRLSAALHLGLLSARELAARLLPLAARSSGAEAWLRQLAWRDFYAQLLAHTPHAVRRAWRPEYAFIEWEEDPDGYAAWCEGRTGYPIVDAAMRELSESGFMHNRARMIVASFLVKDLLIDWRRGEAHFLRHLVDGDIAANNGGWQWSAGTGADAQPYFRILNPVRQSERFDPDGAYIRRWLPELAALPDRALHAPWEHPDALVSAGIELGRDYPTPIVDHAFARTRTLERYGRALGKR